MVTQYLQLLENVCSRRNERPGELNQALSTGPDGGFLGGDEVPHLEASPGSAQPHAGQPAADLEARRGGPACHHLALALRLRLLHAGNPW